MATENVLDFLNRLISDDELAAKADDAWVAGLHAVAEGAGYRFSEDELRAGMDAAAQQPLPESLEELDELSEEELDNVVGAGGLIGATGDTVFAGISSDTVFAGISMQTADAVSLRFSSFSRTGFLRR